MGVAALDTVYAFGYCGAEDPPAGQAPSCSKRSVSTPTPGTAAVTAHADVGFSSGPIVDYAGRLVGVVKGGLATGTLIL